MTAEEAAEVRRLASSRAEPARAVERAPAIAGELRVSEGAVRLWIKRFDERGLPGLGDLPRSSKPPVYTAGQVAR